MNNIDLTNKKIWIGNNPELSKKVQQIAFDNDWKWYDVNKKYSHIDSQSLYFNKDKYILYTSDSSKSYFEEESQEEIFPSDLGITEELIYEIF